METIPLGIEAGKAIAQEDETRFATAKIEILDLQERLGHARRELAEAMAALAGGKEIRPPTEARDTLLGTLNTPSEHSPKTDSTQVDRQVP